MAQAKNELTFFDKIINVTFYKWLRDPETNIVRLMEAFAIRSDRPWLGYRYFDVVKPPDIDDPEHSYIAEDPNNQSFNKAKKWVGDKLGFKEIDYYGPKPNIRLQMTQLAETVCTNVTLTIENLTMEINIDDYQAMYIEAGYGYSNNAVQLTAKFFASIFSSYVESPNPSGRTVFTGIVGNWFVNGLRAQPYTLVIEPGSTGVATFTIKNLIDIVCSYLGVYPQIDLPERILNYQITEDADVKRRAQSGYQVLDWLSKSITDISNTLRRTPDPDNEGKGMIDKDDLIASYFYDNHFFVSLLKEATSEDMKKVAVNLNKITAASFQGGALSVTAPWNPLLLPGQLFHMDRTFFRGRMMPNVALTALKDELSLYRPITIDIAFETASNVNQMRVMAVAARLKDETINPQDEPRVTSEYEITIDGEIRQITLRQAQQAEAATTQDLVEGRSANFYADEDPYAVGLLKGNLLPVQQEIVRRKQEALRVNSSDSGLVNQDIVIVLNQHAISAWAQLTEELAELEEKQTVTKPLTQAEVITLEDPSRIATFIDKVSSSSYGLMRTSVVDWNTPSLSLFYREIAKNWFIPSGLMYISKDRGFMADEQFNGTTRLRSRVPIIWLIRVLGALMSYAEFTWTVKEQQVNEVTDIWKGNTYNFLPIADTRTNKEVRNLFPPIGKDFGDILYAVPFIASSDELNKLLDTHSAYIQAVIDYWRKLQALITNPPITVISQIQDLEDILYWHNNWRNTPWKGWKQSPAYSGDPLEVAW